MKKLSLLLGYECNNNCIFCYDGAGYKRNRYPPITTEEAKRRLEQGREAGCDMVDFLGGEPTIRRDLLELIKYAKELGYEQISITTNGRMLSYYDYARKLVEAGLNSVIFSVHGCRKEIHDALTRTPGSFEQQMRGIENILRLREKEGYSIYLADNTVMTKINMEYLPQILEYLWNFEFDSITFLFPHPRGNADAYFYQVVPRLPELKPHVDKTTEKHRELVKKTGRKNVKFTFRYLPLCYLYPDIDYSDEYFERKVGFEEKHVGPEFEDWNVELGREVYGKIKPPRCERCAIKDICEGVWIEYVERYGTEDLISITTLRI